MKDFRRLQVWRKAHELTLEVYRLARRLPPDERFGLTAQIRRACASIPTNIAEGCGRSGDGEFGRFLSIAMGSASELEYLVLLVRDLRLLEGQECTQLMRLTVEVKRMIASLLTKVRTSNQGRRRPNADR